MHYLPGGAAFPETRWTLVIEARGNPAKRRPALEALVRPRWKPLYLMARAHGLVPEQAEDAVQSFLTRLVEGDVLEQLDPGRGRLRSYLKTAFRHHLINLAEHERAAKRGLGVPHAELHELESQLAAHVPPADVLFDRAWAAELVTRVLSELEAEYARGERVGPFEVVRQLFAFGSAPPYAELAEQYGMTVPQLKAFVHRARGRFRQLLNARVADTLVAGEDLQDEVASLLSAMAA